MGRKFLYHAVQEDNAVTDLGKTFLKPLAKEPFALDERHEANQGLMRPLKVA